MKTKHKILFNRMHICLWLLSLSLFSCVREYEIGDKAIDGIMTEISATIISEYSVRSTKAGSLQFEKEEKISSIKLLVFDNNDKLKAIVDGTKVSTGHFTFKIASSSTPISLYFVANSPGAFGSQATLIGKGLSDVKSTLVTSFTEIQSSDAFPMVGRKQLGSLLATTDNNFTISMQRSIARSDVIVKSDIPKETLEIVNARIFRVNSQVQIIPGSVADWSSPTVTTPSVPIGSLKNIITDRVNATADNKIVASLYLSESVAVTNPSEQTSSSTAIVVGARYRGGGVSYYRIDFNSGLDGHPFGQVLRNFNYEFKIIGANSDGWPTPEDAANNKSTGITAEITQWDDNTTNMYFDGSFFFGVSTRLVNLSYEYNSTGSILVNTNVPDYTVEWADNSGNGLGSAVSWGVPMENDRFRIKIKSDGTEIFVTALENNTSGNAYTQNILIKAAGMRIKVLLSQHSLSSPGTHIPLMRVLTFGLDNGYGYNLSGRGLAYNLLNDRRNFGRIVGPNAATSSKVQSEGFRLIDGEKSVDVAKLQNWLIDDPVDIVVMGFDYYTTKAIFDSYFLPFLKKGGVMLAFQEDALLLVSCPLINSVFEIQTGTLSAARVSGADAGSIYTFANLPDDPIINGPFGNVSGKYWGEDASYTVQISGDASFSTTYNNQIADKIIEYSNNHDRTNANIPGTSRPTMFRHKQYNLMWCGDAGFHSGWKDEVSKTSNTICPFMVDVNNTPIPKLSYGRWLLPENRVAVHNSIFFANSVAWALVQAEKTRIERLKNGNGWVIPPPSL